MTQEGITTRRAMPFNAHINAAQHELKRLKPTMPRRDARQEAHTPRRCESNKLPMNADANSESTSETYMGPLPRPGSLKPFPAAEHDLIAQVAAAFNAFLLEGLAVESGSGSVEGIWGSRIADKTFA